MQISAMARNVFRALPVPVANALRRLLFPFRNRGLFAPYVIHKDMEGESFEFLIGDRTGRDWYDRPCINNPRWLEMRFIKEHMAAPGDVILECGGHHGCSAILLSRWVGAAGSVVTFEPFPENCDILARNLTLNALTNVTLERKAVGATDGHITVEPASSGVDLSGHGRRVPLVRLDDYAHLRPTFLKIDVEGFEVDVLRGAVALLATCPKLALEIHADLLAQYGASVQDVFDLIGLDRYDTWVQWTDDQQPVPFDASITIDHRVHVFCLPRGHRTP